MPREYLCQYGNCQSTTIMVTVTKKDSGTKRFCCELHAAASLLRDAFRWPEHVRVDDISPRAALAAVLVVVNYADANPDHEPWQEGERAGRI